jgi:hypothetical protein
MDYDCGAVGGMNEWQDKPKYWEETCPSAALSTAYPTGLYGDRPTANHLSYRAVVIELSKISLLLS